MKDVCDGVPRDITIGPKVKVVSTSSDSPISAAQKIQKLSESPGTAHMVAKLCVIFLFFQLKLEEQKNHSKISSTNYPRGIPHICHF